jgi:hypothetical protein
MSYENLINKLKQSDAKKNDDSFEDKNDRKLGFLEFKDPSILRFRIFPHKKDPDDVPFEQVFIHLGFEHPNYGKRVPMSCKGRDCPLCSFYKKRQSGGDANAWRYKSNSRFIYYVEYVTEQGKPKMGLLSLTYYAHEALKDKMISLLRQGINIFDLKDGRWIEMTMKKIGDKRKYTVSVESDSDEVADMDILEWYKELKPLHKFYREYSVEDLKKILKGEKLENLSSGNRAASNSSSASSTNRNTDKKPNMKFASDEVESIDDEPKSSAKPKAKDEEEGGTSNMRRLEDIMNRSDEEDFE